MNLFRKILKQLLCILLCLFTYSGIAQTDLFSDIEGVSSSIDTNGIAMPKAIATINIVREIDNATNQLKLTQRKIKIPNSIKKIDSIHTLHSQFLLQESNTVETFMKANPNLQKINNLISKWYGYKVTLNGWQSTVNNQEIRNSRFINDIILKEKTWDLSYKKAIENGVPNEILNAIKDVLDKTKETKTAIINNNNYYLILETSIDAQISITEQVMDDLSELKNSDVYNIFHKRHAALWNTSFTGNPKNSKEKDDIESIKDNVSSSYEYLKSRISVIFFYLVFVYAIALFIRRLRTGFFKYEYKERTKKLQTAKSIIINQNTISIVFLSLLLAKLMFTNTPKLFSDITTLLVLACTIPLIRPYMHKQFKGIILFVILFFVLNSSKSYIWFSSGIYRIYIMFEALTVIAILYKFTNPYLETRKLTVDAFGQFLIRLTPIIYLLSIISIISNILGYTNLTDLSLKISTQSGIITTFFYTLLMIGNGITVGVINSHYGVKPSYVESDRLRIEKLTLKVSRVIVGIIWSFYFLSIIDVLTPIIETVQDSITEPYQIGSLSFTLEGVLGFILTLIITYALTKIISFLINDDDGVLRFFKFSKGIPSAISLVIRYFILGFGIILALGALGIDLSKFNLMAGALGLGIGFGLQTVISNFVSGLILVFERPILPGDTVEVNNLLGTVNRIGVRSSNISTFDGAEVVVPNNNLISNDLINWTLSNNTKRVEVLIGTSYDSDPNRVLEILTEIATENQYTLNDPPPRALFNDFGDSSLNFRLLFWVHYEVGLQSKSDISISIYNRFKAEGIEIPFPQRDLNVRSFPDNLNAVTTDSNIKNNSIEAKKPLIKPLDSNNESTSK